MNSSSSTVDDQDIRKAVLNLIHNIEQQHSIKIIFACEGGSRGWGTQTLTSDCDVRGIYIRKEEEYLSISKGKGVISAYTQPLQGTNLEIDYIFQDLRTFLKRNIKNEKNQLNFILQSKNTYVDLIPQQTLNFLKANLPIPIRGVVGHIMDLYKCIGKDKIDPKSAVSCIVFGLQMIHIIYFQTYPFYSCEDEVNFLRNIINQQNVHLESDEKTKNINQKLKELQIDVIVDKFEHFLQMKRNKISHIPEEDSNLIKQFMQTLHDLKYDKFSQPLSSSQLDEQFNSVLNHLNKN